MDGGDESEDEPLFVPPVDDSPSAGYSSCPECHTTKQMDPRLQLLFSTCCGRCMCTGCIDARFKSVKVWACTLCHEVLKRADDWKLVPLEQQRALKEVENRDKWNRTHVLCLERVDFPTARAYDDYLESTAEWIFQLTYGGKQAAEQAKRAMELFTRDNQALIDKSRKRRHANLMAAERRELLAQRGLDSAQQQLSGLGVGGGGGGNAMSFSLPQPLDGSSATPGSGSLWVSEEARVSAIADPKRRQGARVALEEIRRTAGGFRRDDVAKRSRQDALDGLFF